MQKLPTSRTRFGPDIVAEFVPPEKPSSRVIIAMSGHPGYSGGKEALMAHYARRGYWVIVPRIRGTWESSGTFLERPPSEDVCIIMDHLGDFEDLWSGAEHSIHDPEVYIIGGSFGGPAALLSSRDVRVKKVATLSAVTDWREQKHTVEPLDLMSAFVPAAFGMAYRADPSVWQKLAQGDFYNPATARDKVDGSKILMLHGRGDRVVHAEPGRAFANEIGARFVELATDEHMGAGSASAPSIAKHIEKHFKAS